MAPTPPKAAPEMIPTGEIFSGCFRFYKDNLATLVTACLAPNGLAMAADYGLEWMGLAPGPRGLASLPLMVALNGYTMVLVAQAAQQARQGQLDEPARLLARPFGANLLGAMAAYALATLLILLAFFPVVVPMAMAQAGQPLPPLVNLFFSFFLLPGMMMGGKVAPVIPVLALENRGAIASIQRAYQLMRGQTLAGMAVFSFATVVGSLLPLGLIALTGFGPFSSLLAALLQAATMPLAYGANVYLYYALIRQPEATPPAPSQN